MYAQILIELNTRQLDRLFTYQLPETLKDSAQPGKKVEVPFRNRIEHGYIISLTEQTDFKGKLHFVRRIIDEDIVLSEELMQVARWLADNSFVSLAKAYETVFPTVGAGHINKDRGSLRITAKGKEKLKAMRKCPTREALSVLEKEERINWRELKKQLELGRGVLDRLTREKLVSVHPPLSRILTKNPAELTEQQKKAYKRIEESLNTKRPDRFLLFGVTGSGKTEIYLEAIKTCLQNGRQALVLLPEISLTEEMIERYERVFGDQVVAWHSQVTPSRKKIVWNKLRSGEGKVLLGARSAVFTGMQDPGLIIVDEEQESSFRQNTAPCYDGREVALLRGKLNDAVVIFGSATPSVETWHRVQSGEMIELNLEERYGKNFLPEINVVDMRRELARDNYSLFSRELAEEINTCLDQKKKVLLFLNRRGYSGAFVCRECGHTIQCRNCDISMTYHRVDDCLKCHYCGYSISAVRICPSCGSEKIRSFGTGTQKVEQALKQQFPNARSARIDGDIKKTGGERKQLIEGAKTGDTDILIGTQMIAKGIDFPNVGLVAVLAADLGLNIPDFRSREKTCQQLIQVAGRAGRKDGEGKCFIQTYQPHNLAVVYGKEVRYREFLEMELAQRKTMGYPPYRQAVRILFLSEKREKASGYAKVFARYLEQEISDFLGPVPAAYVRIKGMYRWHVIIMGPDLEFIKSGVRKAIKATEKEKTDSGVYLNVEINPGSML